MYIGGGDLANPFPLLRRVAHDDWEREFLLPGAVFDGRDPEVHLLARRYLVEDSDQRHVDGVGVAVRNVVPPRLEVLGTVGWVASDFPAEHLDREDRDGVLRLAVFVDPVGAPDA